MQTELKFNSCLSGRGQDGMEARLVDLFHSTIQASGCQASSRMPARLPYRRFKHDDELVHMYGGFRKAM